jgi:hypothetical protein
MLNKKKKLQSIMIEQKEYSVRYIEKLKQNRKNFAERIFSDFVKAFDTGEFSIKNSDKKILISSSITGYLLELVTDIDANPKHALSFLISKLENNSEKITEYLMRPFDDSPLPEPDWNNFENTYKGMTSLDRELFDEQRKLDYFKSYIQKDIGFEGYIFYCESKQPVNVIGTFETVKELVDKIR